MLLNLPFDYQTTNDPTGTKWAQFAGDPNYNLLNECCLAINSGNPQQTGFTTISQQTMDYMIEDEGELDSFRT